MHERLSTGKTLYKRVYLDHFEANPSASSQASMAPTDKAKAAGVSVTSFFDLKAELAKKSDEFARSKAAGGSKYVPGEGRTRPDKVCTSFVVLVMCSTRRILLMTFYMMCSETDCMGAIEQGRGWPRSA